MSLQEQQIPVIDLFAGPGGLGEGFSAFRDKDPVFKIGLSVEKDTFAHRTLELRAFYRHFSGKAPKEYYEFLRGEIDRDTLFNMYPQAATTAKNEARHIELGEDTHAETDELIENALGGEKNWVLIGGPPCQAYSLVGRSRNKGNSEYEPEKDHRHFLYREYLRIIAEHCPPVFVMENVKGILSSKINGERIFPQILKDLRQPFTVVPQNDLFRCYKYSIYSLVKPVTSDLFDDTELNPQDYIIKSEFYGVPQARHRVILIGIREDFNNINTKTLKEKTKISVKDVLDDLPRVRSGLSKGDSPAGWKEAVDEICKASWLKVVDSDVKELINKCLDNFKLPRKNRGAEYISINKPVSTLKNWYHDSRLRGACNHTTRGHIAEDLHRYFFVSCYGKVHGRSPKLGDFPDQLLPNHKNSKSGIFSDRFRVQLAGKPSTTVTCHISKDGHYYIHYDPTQCRSLTVREAARLQTFPDNYFFCGPRTSQYHQVGNAVPPYLASQIAGVVLNILRQKSD